MSITNDNNYSIVRPSGAIPNGEWEEYANFTQGLRGEVSSADWQNKGFVQQTFLGASIRNFSINAQFGSASSTMSMQLINDEFNKSDNTGYGEGDDPYHNGQRDLFQPPVVGTPVFFKFGKTRATVEQAFRSTFDTINNTDTYPKDDYTGRGHLTFGGLLQSYTQTKNPAGSPTYQLQIKDPREILSNVSIILNDYSGTTFNNKNLFNVFGFLEYDPSEQTIASFENDPFTTKSVLTKTLASDGTITYVGDDTYTTVTAETIVTKGGGVVFPITGQGFSRRNEKGIPWYRVNQALAALLQMNRALPQEYIDAGFGGFIDFRGYKYVVDVSGFPLEKIPNSYHLDYDSMTFMDLIQELGELINHELYISLLPVIDHPSIEFLYKYNKDIIDERGDELDPNIISGIIRIDAIDRSQQPTYGSIKSYIDSLQENGVEVLNQDVGFELSNVVTDRFVVGAQTVEMYFFNRNKDKDDLQLREYKSGVDNPDSPNSGFEQLKYEQWSHETSLKQSVLPFWGFLGNDKAVTIPRGFGPFKQILLDSSSVDAFGVGNYYLATEIEIRCAMKGFDEWSNFLAKYNDRWIEFRESGENIFRNKLTGQSQLGRLKSKALEEAERHAEMLGPAASWLAVPPSQEEIVKTYYEKYLENLEKSFSVTPNANDELGIIPGLAAPRSVFHSEWHQDQKLTLQGWNEESACFPPYGWPIYWKRCEVLGIRNFGYKGSLGGRIAQGVSDVADFNKEAKQKQRKWTGINSKARQQLRQLETQLNNYLPGSSGYLRIQNEIGQYRTILDQGKAVSQKITEQGGSYGMWWINNAPSVRDKFAVDQFDRSAEANAKKVWEWLKKIGDTNYGKKYLVKIPKKCNVNYKKDISLWEYEPPKGEYDRTAKELSNTITNSINNIKCGPFGFRPLPINSDAGYGESPAFLSFLKDLQDEVSIADKFDYTLTNDSKARYTNGALKGNFNPLNDSFDWNYVPEPAGGYFDYNIYEFSLYNLAKYSQELSPFAEGIDLETTPDQFVTKKPTIIPKTAWPPIVRNMLAPVDMENFLNDEKRMECYARFDHSEALNFGSTPADSLYKQGITAQGFIPNLSIEILDSDLLGLFGNQFGVNEQDFGDKATPSLQPSVAYVKCQVEPELYMTPKSAIYNEMRVFGVDWAGDKFEIPLTMPVMTYPSGTDPCAERKPSTEPYVFPSLYPANTITSDDEEKEILLPSHLDFVKSYNSITGTYTINTNLEDLDPNHVYALVTLPAVVTSSMQTRWRESSLNGSLSEEMLTAYNLDVVDPRVPGFDAGGRLPYVKRLYRECPPSDDAPCSVLTDQSWEETIYFSRPGAGSYSNYQNWQDAWSELKRQALAIKIEQNRKGNAARMAVEPDMFAIPLLSKERCYGPWLSSTPLEPSGEGRVRYSNIGGKIEYEKDEDLSPWRYNGYAEMNRKGYLKAQFTNSLLLFSERGGFVVPDIPSGIFIARALQEGGPLVTNISCAVDGGGISTTVKMDLYTTSFGKLSKANQDLIDRINRDSLKIRDRNNRALRSISAKQQGDNLFEALKSEVFRGVSLAGNKFDLQDKRDAFNSIIVTTEDGAENAALSIVNDSNETKPYNRADAQTRWGAGNIGDLSTSAQVGKETIQLPGSTKELFGTNYRPSDKAPKN